MKHGLLLGIALIFLPVNGWAQPLFEYVSRPDTAFKWEKIDETPVASGVVVTNLKVTSQVWEDITWTHRVQVVTPPEMKYPETALMLITGSGGGDEEIPYLSLLALTVSAPIVVLRDVPNQPLFDDLREDALIAFTFVKCLETGDREWPLLFPMTKAAVKTMDAIEQYTAEAWETPVSSFCVTGASKRGWTTWLTGVVVPERVKGIAPMVYDNLDLPAQMAHQIEAWGDYSPMIDDYTRLNLPDLLTTPEVAGLAAMVDPYTERQRAIMPKLIITGTNDAYWPLDAANLYFDDLPDPKYILYVPNSGHGLEDLMRVVNSQVGFFLACTGRAPLPRPTWEFSGDGEVELTISSDLAPSRVAQWTATSATRDFREAKWEERAAVQEGGAYVCRLARPEQGFAAIFGEVTYRVEGRDCSLSTNVRIIGAQ